MCCSPLLPFLCLCLFFCSQKDLFFVILWEEGRKKGAMIGFFWCCCFCYSFQSWWQSFCPKTNWWFFSLACLLSFYFIFGSCGSWFRTWLSPGYPPESRRVRLQALGSMTDCLSYIRPENYINPFLFLKLTFYFLLCSEIRAQLNLRVVWSLCWFVGFNVIIPVYLKWFENNCDKSLNCVL